MFVFKAKTIIKPILVCYKLMKLISFHSIATIFCSDLVFVVISLHCKLKCIKKLKYFLAYVCYLPLPVRWTGALWVVSRMLKYPTKARSKECRHMYKKLSSCLGFSNVHKINRETARAKNRLRNFQLHEFSQHAVNESLSLEKNPSRFLLCGINY